MVRQPSLGIRERLTDTFDDRTEEDEPGETVCDYVFASPVGRLMRSDSATSTLRIEVVVEVGVVTLRSKVQTMEDTDNAAEVAPRVPGAVDVIDEPEAEDCSPWR